MNGIALTPAQHALVTEELRHFLESRDLEEARMNGRVTRTAIADIRHSARMDAAYVAQRIGVALALPADSQPPVKHSLAELVAAVAVRRPSMTF
jgi:hypothetical protein